MVIKYRAWLKVEKKMYEVKSIDFLNDKVGLIGAGTVDLSEVELLPSSTYLDNPMYPDTQEIYAGDIMKNDDGTIFEVHFGEHQMYCPADQQYMHNMGFYVTSPNYRLDKFHMPMGPTEMYATKIGNIYQNPELLEVDY
jgi:hypothetical protein